MTDTQSKRDPRYTRTVGEKPNQGRRYVENGKVRIEWYEDGKRRKRTIGENSAETRREADEELERLLAAADHDPDVEVDDELEIDEECYVVDISWLVEGFRSNAEKLMDVADDLAESFENGLVKVLSLFNRPEDHDDVVVVDDDEVEGAEIVDESDGDEEPEKYD